MMMKRLQYDVIPQAPFDWESMIRRLQGVGHELFRFRGAVLLRSIRYDDQVIGLRAESLGTVDAPRLQITLERLDQNKSIINVEGLQQHLRTMFSTDVDLQSCYKLMRADAELASLTEQFCGLRFILEANLFECMTKTIIGQQLNLAFASTLTRRLMELTTEVVLWEGIELPVFPSAEMVAALDYEQLRELQFSQRKAEYVIDFARLVVNGEIKLTALGAKSNEDIVSELSKVRGIGRWTVECYLMFGLGRTDLLPAADIGLRNGVKKLYQLEERPSEAEVREIGAAWAPWSSYVTFYVWETLNNKAKE